MRRCRRARDSGLSPNFWRAVLVEGLRLHHVDALGDGDEAIDAEFGHGLVGLGDGFGIEFDPAGVGQFDVAAGGGGEALEVGGGELHALLFPFGGDGEPVDAAALDEELGLV